MIDMKVLRFLTEKGQTAVEYLLILSVSIALALTFFRKLNEYFFDTNNPKSYMAVHMRFYKELYDPQHGYKKFRLPR